MVADIEKALKYPLNFKPLFILGMIFVVMFVVAFIPFLLLIPARESAAIFTPALIAYVIILLASMVIISSSLSGYLIHVSRSIIAGNLEKAPELNGFGSLLVDGLKFTVIAFVYAIPPLLIAFLAIVVLNVLGLFLMFFLIPLFYVSQLAGVHLAYTNSLKKALDIPYIYDMIFSHLKGFSLGVLFYLVTSFVFSIAGLLIITYPFIIVASYVAGQYIFTIFYMESAGLIEEIDF